MFRFGKNSSSSNSGRWLLLLVITFMAPAVVAETYTYDKAKVSFADFEGLVAQVKSHRESRLIDLDTFLKMSKRPDVVILDSRSKFRFDRLHLEGAKHLNFSDFTQQNLEEVIPSYDTTVLIYCNNNFTGNETEFPSKVALPTAEMMPSAQMSVQEKPLMLALNVPVYINLYGYGYRNVYELHELINVDDPRVEFEGSRSVEDTKSKF
ncbi:rhodanese-like domain-containing protein [Marinobacteraceae bacterium S3BR75-40.1]